MFKRLSWNIYNNMEVNYKPLITLTGDRASPLGSFEKIEKELLNYQLIHFCNLNFFNE